MREEEKKEQKGERAETEDQELREPGEHMTTVAGLIGMRSP